MLKKYLLPQLVLCFFLNAHAQQVTIHLNEAKPEKNLKKSYVGYDMEDFACGFNFNWMLTEGRKEFSKFARRAGVRCLRFAEMSRYSWRSEEATRRMRAACFAAKYPKHPQIAKNALKSKLKWWFSPELFWDFCRENRIVVMPMFNAESFYNPADGKAYYFVNKPEYYQAAAKEAAAYVKYLKDKGYLDMAKVWEIGNECYLKSWKPVEYAAYVKVLAKAVREVQPEIKLAVPVFICSPDNPDVKVIMKRIKNTSVAGKKKEWQIYDEAMKWTANVIKALGDDAQHISHGVQHSYGAGPKYNSNYKGIDSTYKLQQALPGSSKWRLVNTEWRDRSGENLWCHRAFWNAALWKAKFTLQLMSYPQMDYTAAHSLFAFSGGLYWSDGRQWVLQFRSNREKLFDSRNTEGKPRFDIGAFGPVARVCNDLIDTHPNMLQHKAGLGKMSSALYYDSLYKHQGDEAVSVKSDLDYLVAVNDSYDSLGMILINTYNKAVKVNIESTFGKAEVGAAQIELLSCDPALLNQLEIPGSGFYPWKLSYYGQNSQNYLMVPANSVMKVLVPFKFSGKKLPGGANLIPLIKPRRLPRGFYGNGGAKVNVDSAAELKISNPDSAKTVYLVIPSYNIKSSEKTRSFSFSLKHKSLKGKPISCSALIAGEKWQKIAAKGFKATGGWKELEFDFTLKAKTKVKLIRLNIYNLPKEGSLILKNFKLKEIN